MKTIKMIVSAAALLVLTVAWVMVMASYGILLALTYVPEKLLDAINASGRSLRKWGAWFE